MITSEARVSNNINCWSDYLFDYDSIDKQNQICYDKIASEYDLVEHETCRNFEQCTADHLSKFTEENKKFTGRHYLDIGVGTGATLNVLLDWIRNNKLNVDIIDISQNMLDITTCRFKSIIRNSFCQSAHKLGFGFDNYDLVVASMCDPYLTNRFLDQVSRTCSLGGRLVITFPSVSWILNSNRSSLEKNAFNTRHGLLEGFSFSIDPIMCINILSDYGFQLHSRRDYSLSHLRNPSKLNRGILTSAGDMPFCHAFTFTFTR